jgi:hypothetical protein
MLDQGEDGERFCSMLVVSITIVSEAGVVVDRRGGGDTFRAFRVATDAGRTDLLQLEQSVFVVGAEPAALEVDPPTRWRSWRAGQVTRMRLVAETAHHADQRREPCPPDTELLAVFDARNDRLIDARAVL